MASRFTDSIRAAFQAWKKPKPEPETTIIYDPEARYDAAWWQWTKRGYRTQPYQDARFDIDPATRRNLCAKSRDMEANLYLYQNILSIIEEFVPGYSGLHLVPASSDEAWNELVANWWGPWSKNAFRDTDKPLSEMQTLLTRLWVLDGEVWLMKTKQPDGTPALQVIESHQLETPRVKSGQEGAVIFDGIETDDAGRPVACYIRQRDNSPYGIPGINSFPIDYRSQAFGGTYARVSYDSVFHLFEPVRASQLRGLPWGYGSFDTMQDLLELMDLEMQACRDSGRRATIITNKTGEANLAASRRAKFQIGEVNAQNQTVNKTVPEYFELGRGGETVYQLRGDSITQFKNERPSLQTLEGFRVMAERIARVFGVPVSLVCPDKTQGTLLRAEYSSAAAFMRARSHVLSGLMQGIYSWALEWAKDWDKSLRKVRPPADWDKVVVRPPKSIDVDIGRNSAAIINEIHAGIRSLPGACSELGLNWKDVQDQNIAAWQRAQQRSSETGVPIERIMEPPQPVAAPATEEDEDDQDDEEQTKPANNTNGRFDFRNGHSHHLLTQ